MRPSSSNTRQTSRPWLKRLLADIDSPLEVLKKRLILAIILLQLIDLESLGFSLEADVPFEQQRLYTDICRQSFLWVHQKLVGMLEPYEVISNTDIQAWYEDYSKRDFQVSPPQSTRRPAPTMVAQALVKPPHRISREPSREITTSYNSAQITRTYQAEPIQNSSPILMRTSNNSGTTPVPTTRNLTLGRPI